MKTDAIKQVIQHGIDNIINGWEGKEVADLHHYLYNEDYFIIGTYRAEEFLKEYGVFDAIEKVKEYEQSNFGEVSTDFSDPEKVANMFAYIVGEEVLSNCETVGENWDGKLTDEMIAQIKEELVEQL